MTHEDQVQESITSFWSKIAADYEAHAGNVPIRDSAEYGAWVKAIGEVRPPPPADVLDIATGTGFVALIGAGLGHRVTGIDLSEPMLEEAKAAAVQLGVDVTLRIDDAVEPDFPDERFDAIISRHFIWTLREPVTAFRNWRRLLRPGGRVVAIDGFWFHVEDEEDGPELFRQHYTKETRAALPAMHLSRVEPIVEMFEQAGFERISVGSLVQVHALADAPPAEQPWYAIVAYRPA